MTTAPSHLDESPLTAHGSVLQTGIPNGKIVMWLFLGSEVMFFTGLIGAYIVLRAGQPAWPAPDRNLNIPLTAVNTFFLICSSVTLVWALQSYQRNEPGKGKLGLLATTLIGALFVGIQVYEYIELFHAGVRPDANLFGSCFYVMTGFHGAHVAAGVVAMAVLTVMALLGRFGPRYAQHAPIELTGLYWHFVDLVWIVLFAIVYLV
ncbi:MAG: cytochrome oxidase subunit III [Phycisphaeraceae bacterium]|nr:cytochrome oxidase subunit III [Phycisphaeraceae bacterium]